MINGARGVRGVGCCTAGVASQYGSNDLLGREIFIDRNAQLRAKPEEIISRPSGTALPSTYPPGTSVMYVAGVDASGWPGGSIVVTHKTSNLILAQWCYLWSAVTTKSWYRNGKQHRLVPVGDSSGGTGLRLGVPQFFAEHRQRHGHRDHRDGAGHRLSGRVADRGWPGADRAQ